MILQQSREIDAPAEKIFAVLADPYRHCEFDGSGTVREGLKGSHQLTKGEKFVVNMKLGLPYKMINRVTEFEQDRLIAWTTLAKVVWRFELTPLADGRTLVTETWDTGASPATPFYKLTGFPARTAKSLVATLDRLAAVASA